MVKTKNECLGRASQMQLLKLVFANIPEAPGNLTSERCKLQQVLYSYLFKLYHDVFRKFHVLKHSFKFASESSSTFYKGIFVLKFQLGLFCGFQQKS